MNRIKWVLILTVGGSLLSCSLDDPSHPIAGTWTWLYSAGGIGSSYQSPATIGTERQLLLWESYYSDYIDGELVQQGSSTINQRNTYVLGSENGDVLELDNGWVYGWRLHNDSLYLYDQCFDCFVHVFVRE